MQQALARAGLGANKVRYVVSDTVGGVAPDLPAGTKGTVTGDGVVHVFVDGATSPRDVEATVFHELFHRGYLLADVSSGQGYMTTWLTSDVSYPTG